MKPVEESKEDKHELRHGVGGMKEHYVKGRWDFIAV